MLLRYLRVEMMKLRRSPAVRSLLLVVLFVSLVGILLAAAGDPIAGNAKSVRTATEGKLAWVFLTLGMLGPLLTFLIGASVSKPEHEGGGWDRMETHPGSRHFVPIVKMLVAIGLMAALSACVPVATWGAFRLVSAFGRGMAPSMPWGMAYALAGWYLLGSLSSLAIATWIGSRIAHPAAGVLGGVFAALAAIAGALLLQGAPVLQRLVPWLQPLQAVRTGLGFGAGDGPSGILLRNALVGGCVILSIAATMGFALAGRKSR
jgi:hypothetical protein